nr:ral guanine nucleotide dissociation stimulator-like 1 [Equus asinus]
MPHRGSLSPSSPPPRALQGPPPRPCLHPVLPLSQEFKFIKDIKLVQKAANLYTVQPDQHFGTWFQAMEPLSKEVSYCLSCQLEPQYQWTRKIRLFFKDKKSHSSSSPGLSECLDWQWLNPGAQYRFRPSLGQGSQTAVVLGPQLHR